ncbi:hypothetical protein ACFE04_013609 [Oxalis oulophora]
MASLLMFTPPRVRVYASASQSGASKIKEEKGLLDFVLGSLAKEEQFYEVDPLFKKVEDKSGGGTVIGRNKNTVAVLQPKNNDGGFPGFELSFAKIIDCYNYNNDSTLFNLRQAEFTGTEFDLGNEDDELMNSIQSSIASVLPESNEAVSVFDLPDENSVDEHLFFRLRRFAILSPKPLRNLLGDKADILSTVNPQFPENMLLELCLCDMASLVTFGLLFRWLLPLIDILRRPVFNLLENEERITQKKMKRCHRNIAKIDEEIGQG